MKILITKLNASQHELKIIRKNGELETKVLDTQTYLLHDICHLHVESILRLKDGFWGMLSRGYTIAEISGKTNELSESLRRIEYIVGGTQSVYSGHMNADQFEVFLNHSDWRTEPDYLKLAIDQISTTMNQWTYLPHGERLELFFEI